MPIGGFLTRWPDGGRAELRSMDAGGGIVASEIRHLSADMPSGVWSAAQRSRERRSQYGSSESQKQPSPAAESLRQETGDVVLTVLSFALATD